MVEIFALREYFHEINSEDIRSWEACLKKMENACSKKSYNKIIECDIEFHRLIVTRSNILDVNAIWNLLISRV